MDWLQVIVLALVQGLTEFLPISSSAHLILPAALTDWPDQGLAFDVAVHLGSLSAVLLYFRSEIFGFMTSFLRWCRGGGVDTELLLLFQVATATLPIIVAGFLLKDWIETHLRDTLVIAVATILFGLALWWADRLRGAREAPGWGDALVIGAAQILALIPGTSRSGITMTAALAMGLSRETAARFSFLLSIPTIAGAAVLMLPDAASSERVASWPALAVGALLAGLSAYSCIALFIALIERTGMLPYVIYRLVLGLVLLGLVAAGIGH